MKHLLEHLVDHFIAAACPTAQERELLYAFAQHGRQQLAENAVVAVGHDTLVFADNEVVQFGNEGAGDIAAESPHLVVTNRQGRDDLPPGQALGITGG